MSAFLSFPNDNVYILHVELRYKDSKLKKNPVLLIRTNGL